MLDITYKFNLKYDVNEEEGTLKMLHIINRHQGGEEECVELGEIEMTYEDVLGDITSVELLKKFGFFIRITPAMDKLSGFKASRVELVKEKDNCDYARYYHQFINDNQHGVIHNTPVEDVEKKITISIS